MAGLPDALRSVVFCLHPGLAVRDFSGANRPDRRRCLWCPSALRGAGASAAGADPQADDGPLRHGRGAADQSAGRSARARRVLDAQNELESMRRCVRPPLTEDHAEPAETLVGLVAGSEVKRHLQARAVGVEAAAAPFEWNALGEQALAVG